MSESLNSRRDFIQNAAALLAAAQGLAALSAGGQTAPAGPAGAGSSGPESPVKAPANNLVGCQVGAHTVLDEGIDRAFDLLQQAAAVDTVFVYSHAYGGDLRKPLDWLATDHGVAPRDQRTRNLPLVYVKHDEQFFKDTSLRHPAIDANSEYHDRDLFAEMVGPARKRGMKVYARILEAGPRGIVNFGNVTTVSAGGRRTQTGCWSHPEYKAFWNATAADMFSHYDLDGFQWGAERQSPLVSLLTSGDDTAATCFCEHCMARGKAAGINTEQARAGITQMAAYIRSLRGGAKPGDGPLAGFLRLLLRYPEILAWENLYRTGKEAVMKDMYAVIKKIKPSVPVGWHVDHWHISMNPIARAEMSYEEMAPYSDYLKCVVYHAILGPRTLGYLQGMQRTILGDIPLDDLFNLHYDLLGYDKATEPTAQTAARQGFSPEYIFRETRHSVASANGKTRIYPGIGFDLPQGPKDDEETIYRCVLKAYEAGAAGVVASREYEEMTVPHLKAFGRAVRALAKA